jgi:hypothetical protein
MYRMLQSLSSENNTFKYSKQVTLVGRREKEEVIIAMSTLYGRHRCQWSFTPTLTLCHYSRSLHDRMERQGVWEGGR